MWAEQYINQSYKFSYYFTDSSQIRGFAGWERSHEIIRKQETPEGCSPQKWGYDLIGSRRNSEGSGTLVGEVKRTGRRGEVHSVGNTRTRGLFQKQLVSDQLINIKELMNGHELLHYSFQIAYLNFVQHDLSVLASNGTTYRRWS